MHRLKSLPAWLITTFFLLTVVAGSLYLLMVNVAFADQWLGRSPIFTWIPAVVRAFVPAYAAAVCLVGWRFYPRWKRRPVALLAFLLAQAAFVLALAVLKVVTEPTPGPTSLLWSFGFLAFGIWAAALEARWAPTVVGSQEKTSPAGFSIRAAMLASLFVSACYFIIGPGRRLLAATTEERWGMLLIFILATVGYTTIFLIFLGLVAASSLLAQRFAGPRARLVAFH